MLLVFHSFISPSGVRTSPKLKLCFAIYQKKQIAIKFKVDENSKSKDAVYLIKRKEEKLCVPFFSLSESFYVLYTPLKYLEFLPTYDMVKVLLSHIK